MPYSGPNDDKLPSNVQELSEDKRAQWVEIWNSAHQSCMDDGGDSDECEGKAFAQANGVVMEEDRMTKLTDKERGFLVAMRDIMRQWFGPPDQERAMSMSRIYEQMWTMVDEMDRENGTWTWPIDIYHDDGSMYAIVTRDGALYRVDLDVTGDAVTMGEWTRVMETFTPVADNQETRTIIRRQADGRYRWYSVSASSVLNRVAEIDSRDLFDSFVEHAENTGEYPIRQIIHMGEKWRTGKADWLARDGNLYLSSGLYDDTPIAQLEIAARQNNPEAWGDSIGYIPTANPELIEIAPDVNIPVYRAGINKEISTLLEHDAANLFTVGRITQEATNRMTVSSKQMETLVALHRDAGADDPEAAALATLAELGVEERNRAIDEDGLITRNQDDGDQAQEDADAEPQDGQTGDTEIVLDEAAVRAISAELVNTEPIQAINELLRSNQEQLAQLGQILEAATAENKALKERIGKLAGRIQALERDEGDKQQEWLEDLPAGNRTTVTYRPRQAHQGASNDVEDNPLSAAAIREKALNGAGIPKY